MRQPSRGRATTARWWRVLVALGLLLGSLVLASPSAASSARLLGLDCTESPTPDMPGQGLAGFFGPAPATLPAEEDPFAPDAETTVYEQYGFAGLRWNTYDLGCGPDAANNPEAVIGTSVSNWVMNLPVSVAALGASLTEVAFAPTFLGVFDPMLTQVSSTLHSSLFERWVPPIVALIGLALIVRSRGTALSTAAAAVGWALFVVVVATALFRWPVEAGNVADETVTSTLGIVVDGLNGGQGTDPATSVAANIHTSVLYSAWLAGELGSTDSATAEKYGPELFKAQTLSWREAALVQSDPEAGAELIEDKKQRFAAVAAMIAEEDPAAYEHLTGSRADTRVGYSWLAALAVVLALPFLIMSCLLLLGSFIIVRLAVMMFPAFATLGLFPAARGIVIGVGRTVGTALVNAVVFGIGAAVTIVVIGAILDPATGIPPWLTLVLLPLFSLVMWLTLKPFRRLTSMASRNADPFGEGASLGQAAEKSRRLARRAAVSAASAYAGGAAAGAATARATEETEETPPERAEARPEPGPPHPAPVAVPPSRVVVLPALEAAPAAYRPPAAVATHGMPSAADGRPASASAPGDPRDVPPPAAESVPAPPTEPEWFEGDEVYPIYRPDGDDAHDAA